MIDELHDNVLVMRLLYLLSLFFCCNIIFNAYTQVQSNSLDEKVNRFNILAKNILYNETKKHCDVLQIVNSKKPILVAFEGTAGFSKRSAMFYELLDRLDLLKEFSSGALYRAENFDLFIKLSQKFRSEKTLASPLLLTLVMHNQIITLGKYKVLYYAQNQGDEALECLKFVNEKLISIGETRNIYITGYSWGAYESIKTTFLAEQNGITINGLFTIDPISKNIVDLGKALFSSQDGATLSSKFIKAEWINIYQKTDSKNIIFGIKGSFISGADYNYQIDQTNSMLAKYAHVSIFMDLNLENMFRDFYNNHKISKLQLRTEENLSE